MTQEPSQFKEETEDIHYRAEPGIPISELPFTE